MKTVLKLITLLLFAFLAVSCAKTEGTLPPTTTVPSPSATTPPAMASPTPTPPATVTFDFDSASPAPSVRQSTPFDQTSGGMTAHFSSPADPAAFSVQSRDTTFLTLSQFSGNYLYQNQVFRTNLNIRFSQPLTSIILTFATTDYHGVGEVETPTTIKVTAYMNSTGTTAVGSATAHGSSSSDLFPQGTLSFDSGGRPFNLITMELLPQTPGGTSFLVDNITVTPSG